MLAEMLLYLVLSLRWLRRVLLGALVVLVLWRGDLSFAAPWLLAALITTLALGLEFVDRSKEFER